MTPVWLQGAMVLRDQGTLPHCEDVLIDGDVLHAIGEPASRQSLALGLAPTDGRHCLVGPCLVDPHSVLERPLDGVEETLSSLVSSAAAAGYGQVALLPRAKAWRDAPERLIPQPDHPMRLHSWGAFSLGGAGADLAPHRDLLHAGALGLAEDAALPDLALLDRGLLLGEMGAAPVLLAPRLPSLCAGGFVRECVEALRAGWPVDPVASEQLPLQSLLGLASLHPTRRLVAMNVSTEAGTRLLKGPSTPLATVHWWTLARDSGMLDPADEGWKLVPSLAAPHDRQALIESLRRGDINAVAVNQEPLDAEEQGLPLDQRRPGLAGHRYVLPMLWTALVEERGWAPQELWQALSWGPSALLGSEEERLIEGTPRWLVFDSGRRWRPDMGDPESSLAANQPLLGCDIQGRVLGCGLAGGLRIDPAAPPS